MSEFIIDPQTVSWKELVKILKAFLLSKPDAAAWKDFYDFGAGTTLIELIAGYAAFAKKDLITNRRETYLRYAKNLSSVIGIASNYGYSAYRGKNSHVKIKVLPTSNKSIKKFDVIGSVKNVDLVSLDNYSVLNGQMISIDCVIGNLKQSILTAKDSSLQVFRFINNNVSEDYRVKVSNVEVPLSTEIFKLIEDYYVSITNALGSIDLFYLNNGAYNYISLTDIVLDYVELNNLIYNFPGDLKFFYGNIQGIVSSPIITDTQVLNFYVPPEEKDSIRINAPLRFETQKVIRGREDFRKTFKLLNSLFLDTNGNDISPAKVELTYLKNDESIISSNDKDSYLNTLNSFTNYGVWLYRISDPIKASYKLSIQLKSYPSGDTSDIINEVLEIFAYEHYPDGNIDADNRVKRRSLKLQAEIDLEQIEHELVRLPAIKIARVTVITSPYQVLTPVIRGVFKTTVVVPNNKIYECIKDGTTNNVEPTFSTNIGDLTIEGLPTWSPSTPFTLGQIFLPFTTNNRAYKVTGAGTSSNTEPSWSVVIGDTVPDGSLIWTCIDPLTAPNAVIWKCEDPLIRKLNLNWNEYASLGYGGGVEWF
jgi:hypothetical protein